MYKVSIELLKAARLFGDNSTAFVFVLMVLGAAILGLYLWGYTHKAPKGRAEELQETYQVMTAELLNAVPEGDLVKAVIANLMAKLDKRHPDAYSTVSRLSAGRCGVYSVWLTCNELKNGLLAEYLNGPSGEFAELAADGLELIGAKNSSAALRAVLHADGEEEGVSQELRDALYTAIEQENPLAMCADYIRDNPDDFIDTPNQEIPDADIRYWAFVKPDPAAESDELYSEDNEADSGIDAFEDIDIEESDSFSEEADD